MHEGAGPVCRGTQMVEAAIADTTEAGHGHTTGATAS